MQSSATDSAPDLPSLRKPSASRKVDPNAKWLETDGLGGFACATVSGILTHRSQGMVVAAKTPPLDRYVLVSALEVVVSTPHGEFPVVRRTRAGETDSVQPCAQLRDFESRPWPRWRYVLPGNLLLEQEIFIRRGMPVFVLSWKITPASPSIRLRVRPLFAGRPFDQLRRKSAPFNFEPEIEPWKHTWRLTESAPSLTAICDGQYDHDPVWFEGVTYAEDCEDGVVSTEDLASPGEFSWAAGTGRAHLIFDAGGSLDSHGATATDPAGMSRTFRKAEELRRKLIPNALQQITDHYIVRSTRDDSLHGMAAYPTGSQRSSDALVALRGICLSLGRFEIAQKILKRMLADFSGGLLPSFPRECNEIEGPSFESPDPTLWFILVATEFLDEARRREFPVDGAFAAELEANFLESLSSFERGNSHGMYVNDDGLLARRPAAGSRNAFASDIYNVATQALWLNAVWIGGNFQRAWKNCFLHASAAFAEHFWFDTGGYLCDSLDRDSGTLLKARQVLAVGGLPQPILDEFRSNLVLQRIEDQLWTPYGLRIAVTGTGQAAPICSWLLGPFVEAWLRAHITEPDALTRATKRFIAPWLGLLKEGGLNHIGEGTTDPAAPSVPFYGPATAELLRILTLTDISSR